MQEKPIDQFFNKAGISARTQHGTNDVLVVHVVPDFLQVLSVQVCVCVQCAPSAVSKQFMQHAVSLKQAKGEGAIFLANISSQLVTSTTLKSLLQGP